MRVISCIGDVCEPEKQAPGALLSFFRAQNGLEVKFFQLRQATWARAVIQRFASDHACLDKLFESHLQLVTRLLYDNIYIYY